MASKGDSRIRLLYALFAGSAVFGIGGAIGCLWLMRVSPSVLPGRPSRDIAPSRTLFEAHAHWLVRAYAQLLVGVGAGATLLWVAVLAHPFLLDSLQGATTIIAVAGEGLLVVITILFVKKWADGVWAAERHALPPHVKGE